MLIYLNGTSVISVPTVDFHLWPVSSHEKSCQGSSKYEVSLPWSHRAQGTLDHRPFLHNLCRGQIFQVEQRSHGYSY